MKIIKSLKKKDFCIKKIIKKEKNKIESKTIDYTEFNIDDKLFFILNIGNYEFKKNRQYIIDEIEYKIENNEKIKDIALFIKKFININFGVNINLKEMIEWIEEKYKYKILAIKKKQKND